MKNNACPPAFGVFAACRYLPHQQKICIIQDKTIELARTSTELNRIYGELTQMRENSSLPRHTRLVPAKSYSLSLIKSFCSFSFRKRQNTSLSIVSLILFWTQWTVKKATILWSNPSLYKLNLFKNFDFETG